MTVLKNARILDPHEATVGEGSVLVEGEHIRAVEAKARASGDQVIDLEGAYLLPGLITCHTHLSIVFPFHETDEQESPAITALRCLKRGLDALRAGITTVRTVGELHRADIALREMIRQGWAAGPRIFSAGRSISVTGGHGSGFGALVADGADGFRRAAREELAAGANHLKIFITGGIAHQKEGFEEPQMTVEEMEAVVSVARSRDTYVCAHAGGPEPIRRAVKAGVRSFEHGYRLDRETCREMRQAGCYLVPTLGVTRSPGWMAAHRFEPWTIEKATRAGPDHLESIRLAVKEGVRIVNGTDLPPGDLDENVNVTVREMAFLAEAGLSPLESIRATTTTAAELLGIEDEVGRIAPGFAADLIAVRENPLKDLHALESVFFVMKAGRVIRSASSPQGS
jgi:imidazolonepropionase-like amidohydrolase